MSWIDKVEEVMQGLSAQLGIPYDFERFSGNEDQLPDAYMVYFLVDDPGVGWADGRETSHEARVQVSLFYHDKRVMLTAPDAIEKAFIDAGLSRVESGRIPYQEATGHYGWRCDFRSYERR